MKKLVKPADKGGQIPDPLYGDMLPQGGRVVDWSTYWQRLDMRGDLKTTDVAADTPLGAPQEDAKPSQKTPPSPPPSGGAAKS